MDSFDPSFEAMIRRCNRSFQLGRFDFVSSLIYLTIREADVSIAKKCSVMHDGNEGANQLWQAHVIMNIKLESRGTQKCRR